MRCVCLSTTHRVFHTVSICRMCCVENCVYNFYTTHSLILSHVLYAIIFLQTVRCSLSFFMFTAPFFFSLVVRQFYWLLLFLSVDPLVSDGFSFFLLSFHSKFMTQILLTFFFIPPPSAFSPCFFFQSTSKICSRCNICFHTYPKCYHTLGGRYGSSFSNAHSQYYIFSFIFFPLISFHFCFVFGVVHNDAHL